MKVKFAETVPKDSFFPMSNEDTIKINCEVNKISVSDGASESFNSKLWSEILTDQFIKSVNIDLNWINDSIQIYSNSFQLNDLSWSKRAAYERGSFATLIGLEYFKSENIVKTIAIGDSLIVLIDEDKIVDTHLYKNQFQFQNHPELISTNIFLNDVFFKNDFNEIHYKSWNLNEFKKPLILCTTDALGEWLLKNIEENNEKWKKLLEFSDLSSYEEFILLQRQEKLIRTDDTTLVVLTF